MDAISRSDAQALMPEEASREIIQGLPQQSFALSRFRRVTMGRKQQRLPALTALPVAYWVGSEQGLRKTSKQQWGNKFLNAEEMAVIVPVPRSVLDDSDFDIWGEVKPRIVESIGATFDGTALFGINKPATFDAGLVPSAIAAGSNFQRGSVVGQDLAEDINQVMGKVEADGFDVNGFAARTGLKASLRGLRDKNNQPIFSPSLTAGTPATLYGEPITYIRNAIAWDNTQADLIGGDMGQAMVGIRQDIETRMLLEASLYDTTTGELIYALAQQNMIALMVTFRAAFIVANPINLSNETEATRYPFAVLQPAA